MENTIYFREIAKQWQKEKEPFVKRSTFAIYGIHLKTHLIPAFGNMTSVWEADVQHLVNLKLREGMSPKTIKDILMVLRMILRFAQKHYGWDNPLMEIHFPTRRTKQEPQVMPLEQQRKLIRYLYNHPTTYNLGIALCLSTGMRIGEICALRWEDIDLKAEVVYVNKTLQRIYNPVGFTEVIEDTPKSPHSFRYIPLSSELLRLLTPLKRRADGRHYFLTGTHRPTEPGVYRNYFKRLLKQLDIPDIHFHGLRHSFATRCIESNCDYKTVSELLGHSNVNITLNLYVHPNLAQKKRAIAKSTGIFS